MVYQLLLLKMWDINRISCFSISTRITMDHQGCQIWMQQTFYSSSSYCNIQFFGTKLDIIEEYYTVKRNYFQKRFIMLRKNFTLGFFLKQVTRMIRFYSSTIVSYFWHDLRSYFQEKEYSQGFHVPDLSCVFVSISEIFIDHNHENK